MSGYQQDAAPSTVTDVRVALTVSNAGTATATLTAAQLLGRVIYTTPAAAANLTLPTAALLVAADDKAETGTGFIVDLANRSSANVATLVAGTGVTLSGTAAVGVSSSARLYVRYTNVTSGAEAYDVIRL